MRTADRGLPIGRGSIYVAIVVAALASYFIYQTWFNPSRAVKRRLGEIAGVLSAPDDESEIGRIARLGRLRAYLANDVRLRAGSFELSSRDAIVGVLSGLRPPKGGWDIQFVDVQVAVDSASAAHAGLMIEINTHDPQTGEWLAEQHEATAALERKNAEWIVVRGEIKNRPPQ
ncbi:MAG TPA: hypothetical protein VGY57_16855 [Vicinamibacterales bacterium]|nr:hypothetical protein [Vicinamibacterales bacterium]